MSTKHRKPGAPARVGAQSFARSQGQFRNDEGEAGSRFVYAPYHKEAAHASIIAISYLVELLGTLFFALCVNMARFSLTGSAEPFIGGALLGVVAAASYYLATGWRLNGPKLGELPHHCSWSVTIGYIATFRTGVLPGLGYFAMQTIGALCAGGILYFFGAGVVPTPALANQNQTWFIEIVAPALIVFNILFNHMIGSEVADENEHVRKGHAFGAGTRFLLTAILYQWQGYSFDHVVYFAGFIGLCSGGTCVTDMPFNNAPVFYQLVPILGALVGVALYFIIMLLYSLVGSDNDGVHKLGKRIRTSIQSSQTRPDDLIDTKHI